MGRARRPKHDPRATAMLVRDSLASVEAGAHPLALFMAFDKIRVDTDIVVEALLVGVQCRAWRGQVACIERLGVATVNHDEIVAALIPPMLNAWRREVRDAAATALGRLGDAAAVPALLAAIEDEDGFDVWIHRGHANALLALAPVAIDREPVIALLGRLVERTEALPASKLAFYGYSDFVKKARSMLRKLER